VFQWIKEKANIKDFSASPAAIVFHLSVAAILWLYVQFWVRLNMFQTLQILVVLAPIAIISGKITLSAIAEKVCVSCSSMCFVTVFSAPSRAAKHSPVRDL
jgi:hypothetical protein